MGKRYGNWMGNARTKSTERNWRSRWNKFTTWATSEIDPLTEQPFFTCPAEEIDDVIFKHFTTMKIHLFKKHYENMLKKYFIYLTKQGYKTNSCIGFLTGVRAFFSSECSPITIKNLPANEMAMGEHRFTLKELRDMWLIADTEGKARLSTAVSLGWGINEFLNLKTAEMKNYLKHIDKDGYASFDYRRKKTKARIFGILNPTAVKDLKRYLNTIPEGQPSLWSSSTSAGVGYWFKELSKEAKIDNGSIRFHLLRKYVFSIVHGNCGEKEAKLLVGKKISKSDLTYLQNLQDELLRKYKQNAFKYLNLNPQKTQVDVKKLREEVRREMNEKAQDLQTIVNTFTLKNIHLERRLEKMEKTLKEVSQQLEQQIKYKLSPTREQELQHEIHELCERIDELEATKEWKRTLEELEESKQ